METLVLTLQPGNFNEKPSNGLLRYNPNDEIRPLPTSPEGFFRVTTLLFETPEDQVFTLAQRVTNPGGSQSGLNYVVTYNPDTSEFLSIDEQTGAISQAMFCQSGNSVNCIETNGYFAITGARTYVEDTDGAENRGQPLMGGGFRTWVAPTQDDDKIKGVDLIDIIAGLGGDDRINGKGGNDELFGNSGNDTLIGGRGDDRIAGGDDDDIIKGKSGNDSLRGENGNDFLRGGDGDDRLDGGDGDDRFDGDRGNDIIVTDGGKDIIIIGRKEGQDRVTDFSDGNDRIQLTGKLSFEDLKLRERGNSLVMSFKQDKLLTLRGVDINDISAADFV